MITDILFETNIPIYQIPSGPLGNNILGYSMDGGNYNFEQIINNISIGENSFTFIT